MNKHLFHFIFFLCFSIGSFAQTTNTSSTQQKKATPKATTSKTTTQGKAKKATKPEPAKPKLFQFPANCNDCLFAVELQPDTLYGPIADPKGGGFIMEVTRDSKNQELFEIEHNTVWLTFKVPYASKLMLDIIPENPNDDYDFLLYKATDAYFCNKVVNKRVKPILSNLSTPNADTKGAIGVSLKGDKKLISKKSNETYNGTIDLKKDEVYYLVIDKIASDFKSYKIRLGYHVDGLKQTLRVIDDKNRKPLPADILLVEKNDEDRIALNRKNIASSPVVLVPNTKYTLYVQKEGYFSYFEEFNANKYLADTSIVAKITKILKGAKFDISEIYFVDGYTEIMPESAPAMNPTLQMLLSYPNIKVNIKGLAYSYGLNPEADMQLSKDRAESVKNYYVDLGVKADRITTSGMTKKEIQTIADEALRKNKPFSDVKIEVTISETGE